VNDRDLFGYHANSQSNPSSQSLSEFDTVTVREAVPSHAGVALIGGGISGDITPRWGWRVDARAYWMSSVDRITVTTSSGNSPRPNGLSAVTSTSPAMQISSNTSVLSVMKATLARSGVSFHGHLPWTAKLLGNAAIPLEIWGVVLGGALVAWGLAESSARVAWRNTGGE
jgi:hypothetical protein